MTYGIVTSVASYQTEHNL